MAIYAFNKPESEQRINAVFDSLQAGESRFGWSSEETADQRILRERCDNYGWDSLTTAEKNCYHDFLLEIAPGDFVVHINVPRWGECTLAQVEGAYEFRFEDEDFNHRFAIDPNSILTFNRNDARVHPALSARLKLQGRWWTIYTEDEFFESHQALIDTPALVDPLDELAAPLRTLQDNLKILSRDVRDPLASISEKIHHAHPNKDLENFILEVFKKVPGVKRVRAQRGRADRGADLLVELEFGSIPELVQTIVVQVKSWNGELVQTSPITDIKNAFEYYENANMGLIVTTNTSCSEQFRNELDKLREETQKPVDLLFGSDLALFCLRYGGDLF